MIQLSYQPAFDAAHAIFRFLRLRESLRMPSIEFDKIRILDYYLLFPYRAAEVRLVQADLRVRSLAKKLENKAGYAALPSGEILFERMKSAQVSAAQTMAERGAVDPVALRNGALKFDHFALQPELQERVFMANNQDPDTLEIVIALSKYALLGKDGLKDRTSLLEYRYDNV